MAKFVITDNFYNPEDFTDFPFYINTSTLALQDGASATEATFADDGGYGFTLTGSNLKYTDGELKSGTVSKVEFFSEDGTLLTVTGGGYSANALPTDDIWDLFNLLQQGNDTVQGSDGDDKIFTGLNGGNDKILANDGADIVLGSDGKNTFDGGDGFDTLNYTSSELDKKNAKAGVTIDVAKGTATNPWGEKDTFSHFEYYVGTHKNDTFKGSSAADIFEGYRGNDTFTGGKGGDIFVFYGGAGKDTITDFGKGDQMQLSNLYSDDAMPVEYDTFAEIHSLMTQKSDGVLIDFGGGTSLFFKGLVKADLTETDFTFVDL